MNSVFELSADEVSAAASPGSLASACVVGEPLFTKSVLCCPSSVSGVQGGLVPSGSVVQESLSYEVNHTVDGRVMNPE